MGHPLAVEVPRRRRAVPLVAGGLAIAALAGVVGWFARPSSPERPVVPPPAASPLVSQKPTPSAHRTTQLAHAPVRRKPKDKRGPGHGKHGKHHH